MPSHNKQVYYKAGKVRFNDAAGKVLFQLPPDVDILDLKVYVSTAFDDSGTDLLDIGTAADPDHFANDVVVSATGAATVTLLNPGPQENTRQFDVTATYTGQNANAAAGVAEVGVLYASAFVH
jgi:hypothetical protein